MKMLWKNADTGREVEETISESWSNQPEGYDDMNPEEKAKALLYYYNSTLRPGESERHFVKIIGEIQNPTIKKGKKKLYTVNITTFRGVSIGAVHYYGEIKISDRDDPLFNYSITRELTDKQARELNKMDPTTPAFARLARGSATGRFDTREDIKKEAIKIFEKMDIAEEDDILVLTDTSSYWDSPGEFVFGREELKEAWKGVGNQGDKYELLEKYGFK